MAAKKAVTKRSKARPKLPPEARRAYAEIEGGVRSLGKSIAQIQQGLQKAERRIEADARARIKELRQDARTQLKSLQSRQREVTQRLKKLGVAAEGSWEEVKHSADSILADARATASSVIDRFRSALGA